MFHAKLKDILLAFPCFLCGFFQHSFDAFWNRKHLHLERGSLLGSTHFLNVTKIVTRSRKKWKKLLLTLACDWISPVMNSKTVITQLRFEPALLEKITEAAQLTGLSKADIMRLAMETGLEDLRRLNFNLPALISQTARASSHTLTYDAESDQSNALRVADTD